MNEQAPSPILSAVKPGIIIGLVSMVITYVAYFIDVALLASLVYFISILVLFFGLIIFFGIDFRKESGGFLAFGQAFTFSYFTMLISGFVSILGNIILFQLVDPDLPKVLGEITFESQLNAMERFGVGVDSIPPDQLKEMEKNSSFGFTLLGQLISFGVSFFYYAVLALILGAILKKRDKSLDF